MARYRRNVCVVVRKAGTNLLLVCHRKGLGPGQGWQFPQGGLRPGADLVSEMRRELFEETGLKDVTVIKIAAGPYTYNFPKGLVHKHQTFRGQSQQWVLTEFSGDDASISFALEPAEFDSFSWETAQTVLDKIVYFKKDAYACAMTDLGLL